MLVWETTVRTGHPASDHQALDQIRRQYEPQGLVVQTQPLPQGGLHVRVLRPAPPQQAYGAPPGFGMHAPSAPPGPPQYAAAYAAPAFAAAGFGPGAPGQVFAPAGAAVSEGEERVRYIRKVYGLLAISALFAVVAGWLVTSPLLGSFTLHLDDGTPISVPLVVAVMLQNPVIEYGAFALLTVGVFGASFVSKVRGVNVVALFAVSALMGVELAPMAFVAQVMAGLGHTLSANPVRDAFAMVLAIFAGCTGYVFVTRKDFSFLGATLSMGFFVVLTGCILSFVWGSEPFSLAIASVGSLLAIGFILYQTSWIFRNSEMDDPVDDALGLIVQLRNLFMFLLRIFMSRR